MPIPTELLGTILARLRPDGHPANADSVARVWRVMFDCFSPLIGPLSAGLLFERTLILNATAYPWLQSAIAAASNASALDAFVGVLRERPAADIDAVNRALLKVYTDELAGLLGTSLSSRLLQVAFEPSREQDKT